MDDSTTKQCSRKDNCINPLGSILPATSEYFHKCKSRSDGFNHRCKVCRSAISAKHYQEHKDDIREAYQLNKEDRNQQRRDKYPLIKVKAEFKASRRKSSAKYYNNNKAKHKVSVDNWKSANPEKARSSVRNRRAKMRNADGTHTDADIALQYKSQKGLCWWCGVFVGNEYHVDHRIAIERGGSNWPNNLCIACPSCNTSKSDKLPHEWNGRLL